MNKVFHLCKQGWYRNFHTDTMPQYCVCEKCRHALVSELIGESILETSPDLHSYKILKQRQSTECPVA